MSLIASLPYDTLSALGHLRGLPLEVRQEIYHHYLLLCRWTLAENHLSDLWPQPSLLKDDNYILVKLRAGGCPHYHVQDTNLLCVNSTIYREVEEVLHARFVYLFSTASTSFELTCSFDHHLHACAKTQISRLSFVISINKSPGLDDVQRLRLLLWKESYAMLVQCLSNLSTVCFEIRVPWSPVTAWLHKPMMEKSLAVARPFKNLRIHWVGENHGAHVAQLCENVSGSGGDWPWSGYDESLYLLREERDAGLVPISSERRPDAEGSVGTGLIRSRCANWMNSERTTSSIPISDSAISRVTRRLSSVITCHDQENIFTINT